jgi:hypothetical protein
MNVKKANWALTLRKNWRKNGINFFGMPENTIFHKNNLNMHDKYPKTTYSYSA